MSANGKAEGFERTLTVSDIQSELGVGVSTARSFLKTFGFRFGCHMVIRQPAFRLLQADGTVARWVKGHAGHKGRPFKDDESAARLEKAVDDLCQK